LLEEEGFKSMPECDSDGTETRSSGSAFHISREEMMGYCLFCTDGCKMQNSAVQLTFVFCNAAVIAQWVV